MAGLRLKVLTAACALLAASLAPAADFPELPPPPLQQNRPAPPAAPGPATAPAAGDTAAPAAPYRPLPSVTISARVDQPSVAQDQTVDLIVTLTWEEPASQPALPLDFEFPEPPSADGLTLFANSFHSETTLSGDKVKVSREYTYEFHADKAGASEIKPVAIKYFYIGSRDQAELKTQVIPVTVTPERLTAAKLTANPAVKIGLGLAALACVAGLGWLWIKARRIEEKSVEPERTRHEIARERLKEADRLRMAGDVGAFLKALTAEMKHYCEDVLEIKARSQSRDALAAAVAGKLGGEWRSKIIALEKLADEVKFAGREPRGAELDQAMETLKGLVAEGESMGTGVGESNTDEHGS
ncbi:MAG TPA: BatD family protein [bacterium]|nr:BatD family protein [bacterium]